MMPYGRWTRQGAFMTPLQDCEGVRCHGLFSGSCSFFDEALPGSWTLVLGGRGPGGDAPAAAFGSAPRSAGDSFRH